MALGLSSILPVFGQVSFVFCQVSSPFGAGLVPFLDQVSSPFFGPGLVPFCWPTSPPLLLARSPPLLSARSLSFRQVSFFFGQVSFLSARSLFSSTRSLSFRPGLFPFGQVSFLSARSLSFRPGLLCFLMVCHLGQFRFIPTLRCY